jgi:hypothetical protein
MLGVFENHFKEAVRYSKGIEKYFNMVAFQRRIRDGWQKPTVHLYWGPPGLGKTRRAWHEARILGGDDVYPKAPNKWWCNYYGQEVAIIDECGLEGGITYKQLLNWLDGHPFIAEPKGGSVAPRLKHIFLTSNNPLELWFAGDQRYGLTQQAAIRRRIDEIVYFTEPWTPPIEDEDPPDGYLQNSVSEEWDADIIPIPENPMVIPETPVQNMPQGSDFGGGIWQPRTPRFYDGSSMGVLNFDAAHQQGPGSCYAPESVISSDDDDELAFSSDSDMPGPTPTPGSANDLLIAARAAKQPAFYRD